MIEQDTVGAVELSGAFQLMRVTTAPNPADSDIPPSTVGLSVNDISELGGMNVMLAITDHTGKGSVAFLNGEAFLSFVQQLAKTGIEAGFVVPPTLD